jgi:hypothetical protein
MLHVNARENEGRFIWKLKEDITKSKNSYQNMKLTGNNLLLHNDAVILI